MRKTLSCEKKTLSRVSTGIMLVTPTWRQTSPQETRRRIGKQENHDNVATCLLDNADPPLFGCFLSQFSKTKETAGDLSVAELKVWALARLRWSI